MCLNWLAVQANPELAATPRGGIVSTRVAPPPARTTLIKRTNLSAEPAASARASTLRQAVKRCRSPSKTMTEMHASDGKKRAVPATEDTRRSRFRAGQELDDLDVELPSDCYICPACHQYEEEFFDRMTPAEAAECPLPRCECEQCASCEEKTTAVNEHTLCESCEQDLLHAKCGRCEKYIDTDIADVPECECLCSMCQSQCGGDKNVDGRCELCRNVLEALRCGRCKLYQTTTPAGLDPDELLDMEVAGYSKLPACECPSCLQCSVRPNTGASEDCVQHATRTLLTNWMIGEMASAAVKGASGCSSKTAARSISPSV